MSRTRGAAAGAAGATLSGARPSRGRVFLLVLAGYALFTATYVPINHWSIGRRASVLYLPGERLLPFAPEWEYLYGLSYALPLLLVACRPSARRLAQTALAYLVVLAAAFATYALFPVSLERPAFDPHTLAEQLLALEYRDPPYNHFPSLHVALSWLVYLACRDVFPARRALAALTIGISLSTLFVKQHYIVDVVSGAGLTWAAWRLAGHVLWRREASTATACDPGEAR